MTELEEKIWRDLQIERKNDPERYFSGLGISEDCVMLTSGSYDFGLLCGALWMFQNIERRKFTVEVWKGLEASGLTVHTQISFELMDYLLEKGVHVFSDQIAKTLRREFLSCKHKLEGAQVLFGSRDRGPKSLEDQAAKTTPPESRSHEK